MRSLRACVLGLMVISVLATSLTAGEEKLNSSLKLLRTLRERPIDTSKLEKKMLSAIESEKVVATIKFDHVLSPVEIARYQGLGLSFYYIDGQLARTEAIYPVQIPWSAIDEVSGRTEVLRVEGSWKPCVYPTLNLSAREIEAVDVWSYDDPLGLPLTGRGMRIADFDTGIDVFHPSFFWADGDTFTWLDVNRSGAYEQVWDGIDLNRNGLYDSGESLKFLDGKIFDAAGVFGTGGNGTFEPHWDWLYADLNSNGARDFGPAAGYTESDPTYGEPIFIGLDDNDSGRLEPWEKLVALGTSKILATMNAGLVERLRGTDLLFTDDDDNGHGTAVSGILAGGTIGHSYFTGIAPDAEILAGDFFANVPVSYLIPWARARGADAMLYEFGGFVYDYLDGSSLDEELISIEHATTCQITPSGNLGRGNKHALVTVAAMDSVTFQIVVPAYNGNILSFYSTTLWRKNFTDLTFRIRSPVGSEITLTNEHTYIDDYYVWYDYSTSPRGTDKVDLWVDKNIHVHAMGTWQLKVINNSSFDAEIISNVSDDNSSWDNGSEFLNYFSDEKNVTWPATSDKSLVNGSYSTRGFEGYGGVGGGSIPVGEISAFSGRGRRIDSRSLLDVCSPGNYDVYTPRSHTDWGGDPLGSYRQFSGTSAAGPHVAAAVAIVKQAFPGMCDGQVEFLICSAAATDAFTGDVYNETWGWGKLRILNTIGIAIGIQEMADGKRAPELFLGQNYPNPFNPTTWIPFFLPADGDVSIRIYDVKGRLVKVVRDRWYRGGAHSVRWDGRDGSGRDVASGVYMCVLNQGGEKQTRKLVLIR